MFNNTQTAIKKVALDLKRIIFSITLATELLLIVYFGYAIYARKGNLAANIVMLTLSVAYLIFFIATRNIGGKEGRQLKSKTKKIFKYSKFAVKTMTLVSVLYGAVMAVSSLSVFDIVVIALSLIGWIVQVVFEVILSYVKQEIENFMNSVKLDLEPITRPVSAVSEAIKKIKSKSSAASETPRENPLSKIKSIAKAVRGAKFKAKPSDIVIDAAEYGEEMKALPETAAAEPQTLGEKLNK